MKTEQSKPTVILGSLRQLVGNQFFKSLILTPTVPFLLYRRVIIVLPVSTVKHGQCSSYSVVCSQLNKGPMERGQHQFPGLEGKQTGGPYTVD